MDIFEIGAEPRSDVGKGASRRLRHAGKLPGIVYGGGQDPVMVSLGQNEMLRHLAEESFLSHILTLKLAGSKPEKVVVKDLQWHPYKLTVMHMDFQRVMASEQLRMSIPLHFVSEDQAPGVRLHKGIVTHHMTDVEVECLPADLPEFIDVDVSALDISDSLRLADLTLPANVGLVDLHGFEAMDEDEKEAANQPVVSIQPPVREEVEGEEGEVAEGGAEVPPTPEEPEED